MTKDPFTVQINMSPFPWVECARNGVFKYFRGIDKKTIRRGTLFPECSLIVERQTKSNEYQFMYNIIRTCTIIIFIS